jgi:hypothetical protein
VYGNKWMLRLWRFQSGWRVGGGVGGGGSVLGRTVGACLYYVFFIVLFPEVMEIK